jgi:hypothetical protein
MNWKRMITVSVQRKVPALLLKEGGSSYFGDGFVDLWNPEKASIALSSGCRRHSPDRATY